MSRKNLVSGIVACLVVFVGINFSDAAQRRVPLTGQVRHSSVSRSHATSSHGMPFMFRADHKVKSLGY